MLSLSTRAKIDAFVNTQGVVLGNKYYTLEFTYYDRTGFTCTFLVKSPIAFVDLKKFYPNSRPQAIVTTTAAAAVSYRDVLHFLRDRYKFLTESSDGPVTVGYKGNSYQPNVLRDAGILEILNVETLGVPSIRQLLKKYPFQKTYCPNHVRWERNNCSDVAARLVAIELGQ